MKKLSLCSTFSQKRHSILRGSGGGGWGVVVVGTSSAPSICGITPQAGEGGVSEGGGAALSTDADGEVTTFRFLLLRVTTPVCVDPAAAATAAAAEGKVNVA